MDEYAGLTWMAAGMALMVMEAFAPGAFMVWLGLAALGTGIAVHFGLGPFAWQVVGFGVLAAALIGVALKLRRKRPESLVNTPQSGLVGRDAHALNFEGLEGRVRLGDSDWPARLRPGSPVPAPMAALRVVAVEGMVLIVGLADQGRSEMDQA